MVERIGAQDALTESRGLASRVFFRWIQSVTGFVELPNAPEINVADLPAPGTVKRGSIAFCPNETGGATLVFNTGSDWRRVQDRAVAS